MSGAANGSTERVKREYMARLAVRMDKRSVGTVFFRGPLESSIWEMKRMADGGIVRVRSQLIGDNFTEHRAYNVTCLDGSELKRSNSCCPGTSRTTAGSGATPTPVARHPVIRRISVTGPFTVFMCWHMHSTLSSPRVGERLRHRREAARVLSIGRSRNRPLA